MGEVAVCFGLSGRYEAPDRRAVECSCSIMFGCEDGNASVIEIVWGTESIGVPQEIREFVAPAVELTDPWWKAQPRVDG